MNKKNKAIIFTFLIVGVSLLSLIFINYKMDNNPKDVKSYADKYGLDLAVYINGEKTEELPTDKDGYIFDSMNCQTEGITTASWDSNAEGIVIRTKGPNKCNFYFTSIIDREFNYTGKIKEYIVAKDGTYKLEVWGGKGNDVTSPCCYSGGAGGYSYGNIKLTKGEKIYVVVGGDGTTGYNGGGGGATHMATQDGLLADLVDNQESVLIVAGGGGNASYLGGGNRTPSGAGGGSGGGENGGNSGTVKVTYATWNGKEYVKPEYDASYWSYGATQTKAGCGSGGQCGSFGKGYSSGGGGWYGGGGPSIGGGGSGYIGSSRLIEGTTKTLNGQNNSTGKAKITFIEP